MKPLWMFLAVPAIACFAGTVAATPLNASEKADFVRSGVSSCIASGEDAQVRMIGWPTYCSCIIGKMSDDMTREDVMAVWNAPRIRGEPLERPFPATGRALTRAVFKCV